MKIKILGKKWHLYVLKNRKFKKRFKKCVGMTDTNSKEIFINNKALNFPTVAHELFHAYFYMLCLTSSSLEQNDMEEVAAEIMGNYGKNIVKKTELILKKWK